MNQKENPAPGPDVISLAWNQDMTKGICDCTVVDNNGDPVPFTEVATSISNGCAWEFEEENIIGSRNYAEEINCVANFYKNYINGNGNEGNACATYVHTYDYVDIDVSFTVSGGDEGLSILPQLQVSGTTQNGK